MTVNPLQTTTSAVRFSVKLKDATMNTSAAGQARQMSNDYVGANARSLEGGATSPRSSEPAAEAADSFVGPDEGKVCRGAWTPATLSHVCQPMDIRGRTGPRRLAAGRGRVAIAAL